MKRLNCLIFFFFLKGGLKSPNGFPNEKCAFYLLFFISYRIVLLTWIAFDPIFREIVVEMYKRVHVEISIRDLMRRMYYNCRPTDFFKVEFWASFETNRHFSGRNFGEWKTL